MRQEVVYSVLINWFSLNEFRSLRKRLTVYQAGLKNSATGSVVPGLGTAIGAVVGFGIGILIDLAFTVWVDDYITNVVANN